MRSKQPVLGLDVGTSGVRLVCIGDSHTPGSSPVVQAAAEVALPTGAVVSGEVVDPGVVGEAIAAAWRDTGVRVRDVRIGLAGPRVFMRTVELPAMPDSELAGAVRFCAQDHIPIPLDDAVVDHHVVDSFTGDDGVAMVRVIVVAAHREALERLCSSVSSAGLRVAGADLGAFALVRALASPESSGDGLAEAVVSVGAGLTTVVVHESGSPRFVRTVAIGGETLTAAVPADVPLAFDRCEAAKLGDATADPDTVEAAQRVVDNSINTIVREIQGSLHHWEAQSGRPVSRIRLAGRVGSIPGLAGRMQFILGLPVELAAVAMLSGDDCQVDPAGLASPSLAVAAGLALAGRQGSDVTVDFAPSHGRRRLDGRARLALGGAAAAVAVALGALTVYNAVAISHDRARLEAQGKANDRIRTQIAELGDVRRLDEQLTAGTSRVRGVLAGDVSWSRLLGELAAGMPTDVWLSSFSAQINRDVNGVAAAAPATATATPAPSNWGTVSVTASGLDYRSVASWLERLPELPFLGGLTLGSVTRADGGGVVNFSSNAAITAAAGSDRAATVLGTGR